MKAKYMQHILSSMEKRIETVISEIGKTDIEPPDYKERVVVWYASIIDKIREKEPEYYVRSVNVYESGLFNVDHIEYVYFEEDSKISNTSVNLFDIDEVR